MLFRSAGSEARLGAMLTTASGFEIAEMDLRLRGPGEFFGTRQHGLPEFKLTDLGSELDMLKIARQDAEAIFAKDPALTQPHNAGLRWAILEKFGETLDLAGIG